MRLCSTCKFNVAVHSCLFGRAVMVVVYGVAIVVFHVPREGREHVSNIYPRDGDSGDVAQVRHHGFVEIREVADIPTTTRVHAGGGKRRPEQS